MKTTNLNLPRARWYDLPVPAAAALVIFFLLLIGLIVGRVRSTPSVAAVPTPGLIIMIATQAAAAVVPTAAPVLVAAVMPENVTQRAIGVFGAPDTASYIGSVEAGRAFSPVARYGADWTQVDMGGSGRVFVRTSDLYGVPELVDIAPTEAPMVVVVNVPQSAPAPAYAAPTPAPEQYAVAKTSDFYSTPPYVDPLAQQALIGSDPSALACGGSPICGGLTNEQAQAALDQQRAGR